MNKQQQYITIIVLGIVLVVVWGRQWISPPGKSATPPSGGVAPKSMEPADEELIFKKFSYTAAKRDPLLSPVESVAPEPQPMEMETPPPELTVEGMVWGVQRPSCIVNGRVYSVGDEVEGVRILEVKSQGVIFIYQGRTFTVSPKRR